MPPAGSPSHKSINFRPALAEAVASESEHADRHSQIRTPEPDARFGHRSRMPSIARPGIPLHRGTRATSGPGTGPSPRALYPNTRRPQRFLRRHLAGWLDADIDESEGRGLREAGRMPGRRRQRSRPAPPRAATPPLLDVRFRVAHRPGAGAHSPGSGRFLAAAAACRSSCLRRFRSARAAALSSLPRALLAVSFLSLPPATRGRLRGGEPKGLTSAPCCTAVLRPVRMSPPRKKALAARRKPSSTHMKAATCSSAAGRARVEDFGTHAPAPR